MLLYCLVVIVVVVVVVFVVVFILDVDDNDDLDDKSVREANILASEVVKKPPVGLKIMTRKF